MAKAVGERSAFHGALHLCPAGALFIGADMVNAYLDRQLRSHPFFNGERFGWGDLSVVPLVHAAAMSGNAPAEASALAGWLDRVRAPM